MNLREYAEGAQKKVIWHTFANGGRSFDVQLRMCSKAEIQTAVTKFTTKVLDRTPDRTRNWKDVADMPRFRRWLIESAILGWRYLTFGKAVDLCNLATPNGAKSDWATKEVPFEPTSVEMMLEEALGFEEFVFDTISRVADDEEAREAEEKKVSATTPGASTAS